MRKRFGRKGSFCKQADRWRQRYDSDVSFKVVMKKNNIGSSNSLIYLVYKVSVCSNAHNIGALGQGKFMDT